MVCMVIIVKSFHIYSTLFREDDFRTAYASLGELCSIVPGNVNIMALTATATLSTFEIVKERLSLQEPIVIGVSPNRPNINLSVLPTKTLDSVVDIICEGLEKDRLSYPKTVVFCRSCQDCPKLYDAIIKKLGRAKSEPPGYPNLLEYRLVTMYTRASKSSMKELVMQIFRSDKSILRVLIATTAFSMGIDIPDIHQIYHWGVPSDDVEQNLQEIGRAGRDGKSSYAVLITSKGYNVQQKMKSYCENKDSCRRKKTI